MRTTVWNKFITFNLKCFKYMYGHFNFICWCFLSFEINLYPVSDLTAFLSIVYYAVNDITVLSNIWLNINEINQYNNPIYKTVGLSSLSQRPYCYQYVVFLFYRCQMAYNSPKLFYISVYYRFKQNKNCHELTLTWFLVLVPFTVFLFSRVIEFQKKKK